MIELRELHKDFGSHPVINGISTSIKAGSWTGILAPPRAGLSTLMRLMAGYLAPSQGQVLIHAQDPTQSSQALSQIISYVPAQFSLPPNLNVGEFIRLSGALRRMPNPQKIAEQLCSELGLEDLWPHKINHLNASLQKLVSLAQSLLQHPQLLLLDETLSHLDSWQRSRALQWLKSRASQTTCIIGSHCVEDLSPHCQSILLLHQGRLIQTVKTQHDANPQWLRDALTLADEKPS